MIILDSIKLPWNGDLMSSCQQGAGQSLCQTKYMEHGQGRYGNILDITNICYLGIETC